MARIARLFVPLDVEFATDPKIIKAGPLAAYLFIASLAYAKRAGTEGVIAAEQVPFLAPGLQRHAELAKRLGIVGLWTPVDGGWQITSWARHNLSGDQLAERKDMLRTKAIAANHKRHHVDKNVNEPDCDLCNPGPNGDQESSQLGDGMVPRESEGRGRVEGEEEGEEAAAPPPTGDMTGPPPLKPAAAALKMLLDWKVANECRGPETVYRKAVGPLLKEEWRDELSAYLDGRPRSSAEELAAHVLRVPGVSAAQSEVKRLYHVDPFCESCEGDGWANLAPEGEPAINGPCPCRRPEPYPTADVIPFNRKDSA